MVKRFVQRVGESHLIAEGHQHLLQQREAGGAGRLDIHRLHVHQSAAKRQCEQIASLHIGGTGFKQVEFLRHVCRRIEVVLRLTWTWHVGILRQLLQPNGAIVRTDLAFFAARIGINGQEARQDLSGRRTGRNIRRSQREHRLVGSAGLQRQVVRWLQNVAFLSLLGFGRIDRSLPEILTGEELVGA